MESLLFSTGMTLQNILVPLGFFAFVLLIVYFVTLFNYKTKKAIIEHGGDIDVKKKKFPYLEAGITLLGFSLGLALSGVISQYNMPKTLQFSGILFFTAAGMISAYFIRKKIEKKEEK
ncbi:hypothetical protein QA597_04550 [Marinilabiliaceae bacterium ANBcel2]|nr:hypothetical protein [Marinilabiliaceae bacterium ANBcel2]